MYSNAFRREFQRILKSLEEAEEYDVRITYSGRFMYGKSCIGVVVDSPYVFIAQLVDSFMELIQVNDDLDCVVDLMSELTLLLRGTKSDSLGYDTVLYWTQLEWSDELDNDLEDEEEYDDEEENQE